MKDRAGVSYWHDLWKDKEISKIDINYYTNNLLHKLFSKYLPKSNNIEICEIGCAMSSYLLYFNDYFHFKINGFDYDCESAKKTLNIYKNMGYDANIFCHNFFDIDNITKQYDILFSAGVFEHFENLNESILLTTHYIKKGGFIITLIPNMNGIIGFMQKVLNKKVYDIHIPYKKNDLLYAHEKAGYKTLFCNYYGVYQGGVVNIDKIRFENFIRKLIAIPGKPLNFISKFISIDSKYISPYVIYIGKKCK